MSGIDANQPAHLQLHWSEVPGNEPPPVSGANAAPFADDIVPSEPLPDHSPLEDLRATIHRRPPPAKFGAIDIGSNSVHLVMAEISPDGHFHILGRDKDMVRLGQGGFAQHMLTPRAMTDGMAALTRFVKMAKLKGISKLRAVATSAVREARNGGDFVHEVRDKLGLELHVVSPEEEARLIYLAVRHATDLGDVNSLIIDIGGGSVELVIGNAREPDVLASGKLGSSRIAELFIKSDPPTMSELKALRRHIEQQLEPLLFRIGKRALARCIATSGTAQNIATVCAMRRGVRDVEALLELRVTRAELKALLADLGGTTRDDRARLPGIDMQRLDTILPGTILLLTILRAFGLNEFEYCDMALREGIIIDHISRQRAFLAAREKYPDPRWRSVAQLAERCAYRREHAEQVARLALSLFDQLSGVHGVDPRYRDLLRFGCLLHDIGYLIAHKGHHKHSYYLIRNGGLQGFGEQEIEVIANLARYHRKGRPRKNHYSYQNLSPENRQVVRRLIPIIRLANALDRTHYQIVEDVTGKVDASGVRVSVRTDQDAELELWMARRHGELFKREYGVSLTIDLVELSQQEETRGC